MYLMITLKVTKKQGFTFSLENTVSEKLRAEVKLTEAKVWLSLLSKHFLCSCNHVHNKAFLMVEQIFLSLQVKQSVIISNQLVYTSCLTSYRTT